LKISRLQGQRTRVENFILKFLNQLNIENSNLDIKDFFYANFKDTNFRNTTLIWANLGRADLTGANLCDANLRGANLSRTDLRRAKVTKEQLKGAIIDKTTNLPWSDEKS
jgi:uncharacterized protein YjbI with pentapeptide repeats